MIRFSTFFTTLACLALAVLPAQAAGNIQTVASFVPAPNGINPQCIFRGHDGNLYGVTYTGGIYDDGTVFRLTPGGVLTTIYSFNGPTDGSLPITLILGSDGNFYGASVGDSANPATIFKITPKGVFTVLANLGVGILTPSPSMVQGLDKNFYVVLNNLVYRVTPTGVMTNLGAAGVYDGYSVDSPMIVSQDGTIYGAYFGTIFKVATDGTVTQLAWGSHGITPWFTIEMALNSDGNLTGFATTFLGETQDEFIMTPDGTLSIFTPFGDNPGGVTSLKTAPNGIVYGTGFAGSGTNLGTVFKITDDGIVDLGNYPIADSSYNTVTSVAAITGNSVLCVAANGGTNGWGSVFTMAGSAYHKIYTFDESGGSGPTGNLVEDVQGNIFGTTSLGGSDDGGTVFELPSRGALHTVASFPSTGSFSGASPVGLALSTTGIVYGATAGGGQQNSGFVFRVGARTPYSVISSFPIGMTPLGPLAAGSKGEVYGIAEGGFAGMLYTVSAKGIYSVASNFTTGPIQTLINTSTLSPGPNDSIYGTALAQDGNSLIYKFTSPSSITSVAEFSDFGYSDCPVLVANDGSIYGENDYYDTLYHILPNGTGSTYTPDAGVDFEPIGGMVQDKAGNLYGITDIGFAGDNGGIFKFDTKGNLTLLAQFDDPTLLSKLLIGRDGNLYGTYGTGGTANAGYLFKIVLAPPAPPPAKSHGSPAVVTPSSNANKPGLRG